MTPLGNGAGVNASQCLLYPWYRVFVACLHQQPPILLGAFLRFRHLHLRWQSWKLADPGLLAE